MASTDHDLLQFSTAYEIDKIALSGETSQAVAGTGALSANPLLVELPNTYGKKCLINASYTVDGTNYYDIESEVFFYSAYRAMFMTKASVEMGASDSKIYILMRNGFHNGAGTGISLTFNIKYSLYSPL